GVAAPLTRMCRCRLRGSIFLQTGQNARGSLKNSDPHPPSAALPRKATSPFQGEVKSERHSRPRNRERSISATTDTLSMSGPTVAADRRRRIIAIVGASSGNLVEWYDFYAYAFTSIYFASAFFPTGNATSQLLSTAGIFAVGFFMRPLGGWLFGWIADTHGRRTSMIISVLMMCAGSLMITLMPTYAT